MKRREFIQLSAAAASISTFSNARGEDVALGEKPLLIFGMITDVQYADADPKGERHYRESIPKLKTAVEWLSKQNLPFTLHLGDFIDHDFPCFASVLALLEPLGHPVKHLLGNHDYSIPEEQKSRVVSLLGMPHDYYGFEQSGVRFLMLDTNDRSVYKYPQGSDQDIESEALLEKMKAANADNAQPHNGGVSEAQLAWLERELAAADAEKKPVIVCGHHPLLPADAMRAWNSEAIVAAIDRHACVIAWFNGHNHAGAETVRNGIPYITFKSILQEPGVNAYSVIRVFKDRIEIVGNGREQSRVLAVRGV